MTNHWNDLQHTDAALIMGANPAENHPISFRWLTQAKEKGAKIPYLQDVAHCTLHDPFKHFSQIIRGEMNDNWPTVGTGKWT